MSEYQYYEFLAIDRPLTPGERGELRLLSTRARISANSFINEYHWGTSVLNNPPMIVVKQYIS